MSYCDEHDLTPYFDQSSAHASECSMPNSFFHDSSCDLILDISMVFIKDHYSFVPSLECELYISIDPTSVGLSFESFYPSIILGNESLPFDYFDKVDELVSTSFFNSLYIDDATYLPIFK